MRYTVDRVYAEERLEVFTKLPPSRRGMMLAMNMVALKKNDGVFLLCESQRRGKNGGIAYWILKLSIYTSTYLW